jgi:hypothetical protein
VTAEQGDLPLENVPPGRYTLQVWLESLGTEQRDVAVDGGVATITVEMGGKWRTARAHADVYFAIARLRCRA